MSDMNRKDVFISYKAEEFEEANWVKTVLENNGVSCWMAPMCIQGGASYASEIPQAIRNCTVFVLILSEKCQMSKWVPREVDQAINEGKLIMPFMLENCKLKDDFNFYLTNVQRYAAYESKVNAIDKMLREIKAVLAAKKGATPQSQASQQALQPQPLTPQAPQQAPQPQPQASQQALQPQPLTPQAPQQAPQPQPQTSQQPSQRPVQQKQTQKPVKQQQTCVSQKQKKSPMLTVLGVLAAVVIVLIIGTILLVKGSQVTIAGEKIKKSTYSVTLRDKTISQKDLQLMSELKKLSNITIFNCVIESSDLSVLCTDNIYMLSLENCNLSQEQVDSLTFEKMDDLSHLNISGNASVTKLDGIAAVADTLIYLAINNTGISNIEFLSDFVGIQEFQADNTGITTIEPLSNCTKLYSISVNGNQLTNLKGLENTISLSSISAGYNQLTGIGEISNNVLLRQVYLNHNQISDLSPLAKSKAVLQSVYMDDNKVSDIGFLEGTSELKYLSADRNQITELDALSSCTGLKELSLEGNQLTSLNGLENSTYLSYINASGNQITDASSLSNLPFNATYGCSIDLSDNAISELNFMAGADVTVLNLHGNPIVNLSSLAQCNMNSVVFDYQEAIDYEALAKTQIRFYYVIDCPLDKQIHTKDALGSVTFCTPEEVAEQFSHLKQGIYGESEYLPETVQ